VLFYAQGLIAAARKLTAYPTPLLLTRDISHKGGYTMNASSTVRLHSGNTMPIIGLGTWQLNEDTSATIRHAIDAGYRMIDTSSDYGTQPGVGGAVRGSNVTREDLFIVTKIEEIDDAYNAAKDYVHEMGLDYADLILIHRPPRDGTSVKLWQGLIRARDEGITHDIGVSNYSIDQLQELIGETGETPTVNQIEWSPFGHKVQMLEYCRDNEIIIQAYSPLTRTQELDEPRLVKIAQKYNKSPAQILIRWNIQLGVVPLPKANSWQHIEENIDVFNFEISEEDMATLSSFNEEFSALSGLAYA
jgi:2,5-diketo-D-gluconate reductase A